MTEDIITTQLENGLSDDGLEDLKGLTSHPIIGALQGIQTDQVSKSGSVGVVDVLKGVAIGNLQDRDELIQRIASLEAALSKTAAERDIATAKLSDLKDINILHSLLLAVGTGLLGAYASYDSAGQSSNYGLLLWLGIGSIGLWGTFLIYRAFKK